MASAFSHGFVALALGKVYTFEKMPLRFWVLGVICSILPDADVVGFAFGIKYGDVLGHRGFSHSLLFALLLGLWVAWVAFRGERPMSRRWWGLVFYFFVVTASHGLLDAMTNGGLGIAFFSPFDNTRYFLPWRPVEVSPIGITSFIGYWGLWVLITEVIWIWTPTLLLVVAVWCYRRLLRFSQTRQ